MFKNYIQTQHLKKYVLFKGFKLKDMFSIKIKQTKTICELKTSFFVLIRRKSDRHR
jgi:hypothetical protein